MKELLRIPFTLRGIENIIEVSCKANPGAAESGPDALKVSFDPELCKGYPMMHAYVKDMKNTGYRRLCGWIQLVKREYYSSEALDAPDGVELSVDTDGASVYFAYGYPAEIFDAPCNNLNGNAKGTWTAYTYLADVPSRMNGNKLLYLAGFQWGYEEAIDEGRLRVKLRELKAIGPEQWREHVSCMKAAYPRYDFG